MVFTTIANLQASLRFAHYVLLYHRKVDKKLLKTKTIENTLRELSIVIKNPVEMICSTGFLLSSIL